MDTFDTKQFILTMRQIAEEKNLSFEVVQDALEQALAAAYRKDYGTRDQNVRAKLNATTGAFKMYIVHEVVDEVEDPDTQLTLEEAKKKQPDIKVGEEIEEEVKIGEGFGRVAAQTAKQVILQKLREAERDVVHEEFSGRIGSILNGTVQRVEPKVVYIDLGKAQGILPASEQIPGEHYGAGQRLKVFLRDVETSSRGPQLVLSRANPDFVSLLFEREVPEMENKAVEIKEIAREAGVRTKIAVASTVPGVDPVGTFVGGHGTRVQAVMNELAEEKIDIVPYVEDTVEFIKNALSPTNISKVELDDKEHKATVEVPDDQLSIAIGKNGQNVRLASKLSGWQIDIVSASGEKREAGVAKPEEKRPSSKKDLEASLLATVEESSSDSDTTQKASDEKTETEDTASAKPNDNDTSDTATDNVEATDDSDKDTAANPEDAAKEKSSQPEEESPNKS